MTIATFWGADNMLINENAKIKIALSVDKGHSLIRLLHSTDIPMCCTLQICGGPCTKSVSFKSMISCWGIPVTMRQ